MIYIHSFIIGALIGWIIFLHKRINRNNEIFLDVLKQHDEIINQMVNKPMEINYAQGNKS
jgi:uncharacterized membrane protein YqgA involved in biofilm formation